MTSILKKLKKSISNFYQTKMSDHFESKNIIADHYTANIFIKLQTDINVKFKENEDNIFLHLKTKESSYIILNTGYNPFSLNFITQNTKIIPIEDNEFWINIWMEYELDKIQNSAPLFEIINFLMSEERSQIVLIPLEIISNKYFMTNQHNKMEQSDTVLVMPSYYVPKYMDLPIMSYKFLSQRSPVVIIPYIWNFLHVIADFFNGIFPLALNSEKLEFNFCLFVVFLGNARNFRQKKYPNEDIFYLYFYDIEDIPIDNFLKDEKSPYYSSYLKMIETYIYFHQQYFHTEYNIFMNETKDKIDLIKFGKNIIYKEEPNFGEYINGIINCDFLIANCSIKNTYNKHSLYNKKICEIFVNDKGYQFKGIAPKFKKINNITSYLKNNLVGITKLPRSQKEYQMQQTIEMNQTKLLQEEEIEKEIANKKEIEKKIKLEENIKRKKENQLLLEKKKLAKKLAIEAKELIVKREVAKKREFAKHISKMKSIAKILASEAKIYYEKYFIQSKKEAKILQELDILQLESKDEEYCQIGSPEYKRRLLEWNLEKINPNLFCQPLEKISQLFSENSPNIWLFNLWNYNYPLYSSTKHIFIFIIFNIAYAQNSSSSFTYCNNCINSIIQEINIIGLHHYRGIYV